jgi:hypothetical protein
VNALVVQLLGQRVTLQLKDGTKVKGKLVGAATVGGVLTELLVGSRRRTAIRVAATDLAAPRK